MQNLIETYFISQFSSTLSLAALGPSGVVTAFVNYGFASLSVATLIACSRALANDDLTSVSRAGRFVELTLGLAL